MKNEMDSNYRDRELIEKLKKKYDFNNSDDINELYTLLSTGEIKFESEVGNRFDDRIYDIYIKNKAKSDSDNEKRSKNTKKNKKNKTISDKLKINTRNKLNKDTKSQADTTDTMRKKSQSINKENKENKENLKASLDMDADMIKRVEKELIKQNRIRKIVIFILLIGAIACLGYYFMFYYFADKSERELQNLTKLLDSDSLSSKKSKNKTYQNTKISESERDVLDKYQSIFNSNKKLIGWIKIADTNIDYPVMQCDDNEFYLTHNFDSEEDKAGSLFLDCNNSILEDDDNYIIYGHHLTSGKMFSTLGNYENKDFYEKHKYIKFDTLYEEHTYEVMFAFRSKVYKEDEVVFKYYQFINVNSQEEYQSYMNEMKNLSFYDTGVSAQYGDVLLTLSTCDYHEENGRFVVVAKRIM